MNKESGANACMVVSFVVPSFPVAATTAVAIANITHTRRNILYFIIVSIVHLCLCQRMKERCACRHFLFSLGIKPVKRPSM